MTQLSNAFLYTYNVQYGAVEYNNTVQPHTETIRINLESPNDSLYVVRFIIIYFYRITVASTAGALSARVYLTDDNVYPLILVAHSNTNALYGGAYNHMETNIALVPGIYLRITTLDSSTGGTVCWRLSVTYESIPAMF